jgi:hypothetical protein
VLAISLLFIQFFVFLVFVLLGLVCPGGYASFSQGWLWEYLVTLGTHWFGLLNVSQAGLEPVAGSGSSPLVFSV